MKKAGEHGYDFEILGLLSTWRWQHFHQVKGGIPRC